MNDTTTTIEQLRVRLQDFVQARDWNQFHAPKNLSMALAVEAAELMEHFQWMTVDASRRIHDDPATRQGVEEELADVLCYVLALANSLEIDLSAAVKSKMAKNEAKYPVDKYRGRYR